MRKREGDSRREMRKREGDSRREIGRERETAVESEEERGRQP